MPRNIHVIVLRMVVVLLVLVCLSTAVVTGRYARYTSGATGSDTARVAKFEVSVSSVEAQNVAIPIQPGESAKKYFTVENKSEVSVALRFDVSSVHSNLPLEFVHPVSDVVSPGATTDVPLLITWPGEYSDDKYIGMVDLLRISVNVEQID